MIIVICIWYKNIRHKGSIDFNDLSDFKKAFCKQALPDHHHFQVFLLFFPAISLYLANVRRETTRKVKYQKHLKVYSTSPHEEKFGHFRFL